MKTAAGAWTVLLLLGGPRFVGAQEGSPPEQGSAEETTVEVTATRSGDASTADDTGGCSAYEMLRGTCTESAREASKRPFQVMARVQYRMPVFLDQDAANDLLMRYHVGGEFNLPVEGLYLTAFLGMYQQFFAVDNESPLFMEDALVGMGYRHPVSLQRLGWDRKLMFVHRLGAYLPTSRESQAQKLYVGLDGLSGVRLEVVRRLTLGLNVNAQYAFHELAERAGPEAGSNVRFYVSGSFLAQYLVFDHRRFGSLLLQGSVGYRTYWKYPAADNDVFWSQDYTWDVGLSYSPVKYVSLDISMEQYQSDVLRNGLVQPISEFAWRDETKFVFSLWGRY